MWAIAWLTATVSSPIATPSMTAFLARCVRSSSSSESQSSSAEASPASQIFSMQRFRASCMPANAIAKEVVSLSLSPRHMFPLDVITYTLSTRRAGRTRRRGQPFAPIVDASCVDRCYQVVRESAIWLRFCRAGEMRRGWANVSTFRTPAAKWSGAFLFGSRRGSRVPAAGHAFRCVHSLCNCRSKWLVQGEINFDSKRFKALKL